MVLLVTRARLVIGLCGSCRESIHHQQKSSNETVRVKVGKLSRQDKALMNAEAEDIRGGGGLSGGVLGDRGDQIIRKAGQ